MFNPKSRRAFNVDALEVFAGAGHLAVTVVDTDWEGISGIFEWNAGRAVIDSMAEEGLDANLGLELLGRVARLDLATRESLPLLAFYAAWYHPDPEKRAELRGGLTSAFEEHGAARLIALASPPLLAMITAAPWPIRRGEVAG